MPLSPGERLSHYEIVAEIGAGGMGRVYRARDSRLGRDVAIKVSAEKFSERFEREARVIASLNHPNICTLYDVGPNYLVMELVEGDSPKGPLPLDTALDYARQMAGALDYAHEKGVTHRDLKPANIKITPDGQVKLLDFGLAKVGRTSRSDSENSPTLTMGMTEAGMILGTAAYMSPEQARGKEVDRRADIWSFGVVLYELITGKKLFHGEDVSDILASVLKEEPKFDAVPEQVRPLLQRCLEKDPKKRLRDMGDAMALVGLPAIAARVEGAPSRSRFGGGVAGWTAAGAMTVVAALAFWGPWRAKPAAPQVVRFQIPAPDGVDTQNFAVSPDGRQLAFLVRGSGGKFRVWVRSLDTLQAHELAGTDTPATLPLFWSPDSQSIAFNADGKLRKVDVVGGPPQLITDAPGVGAVGGSWNRDGMILFGSVSGPIMRVPASGGQPIPVTQREANSKDVGHLIPQWLPDGRHFLYIRPGSPSIAPVFAGSLDVEPAKQSSQPISGLLNGAGFVPSSNSWPSMMLFLRQNTLLAQPFDVDGMKLTGEPSAVAETTNSFSTSENGVLVYSTGGGQNAQLTWIDRQGKAAGTVGEPGRYQSVSLSPDSSRAAMVKVDPTAGSWDVWLLDVARNNSTRFTFQGLLIGNPPVWSADGKRLVYSVLAGAGLEIHEKPVDETSGEQVLLKNGELNNPTSWSPDGRFLLYTVLDPKSKEDIGVLPLEGERKPIRLLSTEFSEQGAQFSPDGKRIAYGSDESGRTEVYVRPFEVDAKGVPSVGPKTLVSKGGGSFPSWRKDGKELVYLSLDGNATAVEVTANPTSPFGEPKVLFTPVSGAAGTIAADHQRGLVAIPTASAAAAPFTVVLNWQAGLKK